MTYPHSILSKSDTKLAKRMSKNTAKGNHHPSLQGIHVLSDEESGLSYATDGYAIVVGKLPSLQQHAGKQVLITGNLLKAAAIEIDEPSLKPSAISTVLPSSSPTDMHIYLDAQRLINLLACFDGMVRITVHEPTAPIEIQGTNNNSGARYAVLMPMDPAPSTECFERSTFIQALSQSSQVANQSADQPKESQQE